MQTVANRGKILTVRGGYLVCPNCRKNRHLIQVKPDTEARNLVLYCRVCKTEHIVDIVKGECFQSHGQ